MRPVIAQHVFGAPNSGGPVVALDRIQCNEALNEFEFHRLHQYEPAGGINFKLLKIFRAALKKLSPDMIHVRGLGNEGFHGVLAARLAGVPRILVSIHGTVRDLKYSENWIRHMIVRDVLESATLSMATHIITVCEYAADREFLVPYRNKFVGVVPNGVDLPKVANHDRLTNRHKLGISKDAVVAVCVSRLTREKGYYLLAEAMRALPALRRPVKLLVVGDGPDRTSINEALAGLEGVEVNFLGHRNDVSRILCAADFFIFPSLHENLSNALLEAMSYGLPVVATAVGGNTEVVARGGGMLVSIDAPILLSQAIAKYVDDEALRHRDGIRARKIVEENYTIQHMAERLGAVYRDILAQSKS